MKKAAVILILGLIMFQMIGVFMLFNVKQNHIRQNVKMQIKAGVPDSALTILTFDNEKATSLKWIHNHEFVYKGQMYDVVKTIKSRNETTYFCLPDHQETKLFSNLKKLVGNELAKDKTNSGNKTIVFVNWYFIDRLETGIFATNFKAHIHSPYSFKVTKPDDIFPESPPPRHNVSNI